MSARRSLSSGLTVAVGCLAFQQGTPLCQWPCQVATAPATHMATRPFGAGLDTADCRQAWHGGNEKRAGIPSIRKPSGSREEQGRSPLFWLLSQSLTWVPRLVGHRSFPDVMVPRAADNAYKVCTSLSKLLRSCARQVNSVASPCVMSTSALPKPLPTAWPAPEDGKSA